MTIKAGQLRNRIILQTRTTGQDAMGGETNTWTTWKTVYARIVSLQGNEEFKGQQFAPEVTHQVTLRWLEGVTPMMRVLTADGKIFDIQYANYGERKMDDTLILICKERLGESGDVNVG